MMPRAERFPFRSRDPATGQVGLFPLLPINLSLGQRVISTDGLVDTGAIVNVLPYDIGSELGAIWEKQTVPAQLTGNLAKYEARGLLLTASVAKFPPVRLAFAWSKSNDVPLLLGQMNFFLEFDVCVFRSKLHFEVRPK